MFNNTNTADKKSANALMIIISMLLIVATVVPTLHIFDAEAKSGTTESIPAEHIEIEHGANVLELNADVIVLDDDELNIDEISEKGLSQGKQQDRSKNGSYDPQRNRVELPVINF